MHRLGMSGLCMNWFREMSFGKSRFGVRRFRVRPFRASRCHFRCFGELRLQLIRRYFGHLGHGVVLLSVVSR